MMKVSDYIIKRLVEHGTKHIFLVSGGGSMHLNDSIGKNKDIEYICNHHEQACAIAAEGYARVSGKFGVVNVTTGPGGTNTLTGVIGQWLDSVPVLYISGQVKLETCIKNYDIEGLRQIGDQEINIVDMVKPVTKYANMIKDPKEVKKEVDKAIYIATHGRPGPVWLDVPLNVQGAMIDENDLVEYDSSEDEIKFESEYIKTKVSEVLETLKNCERPVFVAGRGIRIAGAEELFLKVVEKLGVPVVSTFNAVDLIPSGHPLFIGRVGTIGDRAGNFAVQNSDVYLSVGSRNNIRQISYNWQMYARNAKKIIVDIDDKELQKPTLKPDVSVNLDVKIFLEELLRQLDQVLLSGFSNWLEWCLERRKKYPVVLPEYKDAKGGVQPYYFIQQLTEFLPENSIVTSANGTACVALFQAGIVKENQKMWWNSGCASMGYDLPSAIGAYFADKTKHIVCIAGDGSIMMNLQELATIAYYKIPMKIFILNNNGYISIRQTQENFFDKRFVACDDKSGVGFPNFEKIAKSFDLQYKMIENNDQICNNINFIFDSKQAIVCEVMLQKDYKFSPKLSSERLPDGKMISKPLEDMWPFLDRKEFEKNIIVESFNKK
ncbi:thiamine pyrophosphate-binding protein [bacterium]